MPGLCVRRRAILACVVLVGAAIYLVSTIWLHRLHHDLDHGSNNPPPRAALSRAATDAAMARASLPAPDTRYWDGEGEGDPSPAVDTDDVLRMRGVGGAMLMPGMRPSTVGVAAELEKLGRLRREGVLSDAEFTMAKARVISDRRRLAAVQDANKAILLGQFELSKDIERALTRQLHEQAVFLRGLERKWPTPSSGAPTSRSAEGARRGAWGGGDHLGPRIGPPPRQHRPPYGTDYTNER